MAERPKVILSGRIGFCFGVRRAIEMAEAALKKGGRIYSFGSIIHNRQVVEYLAGKGLKVAKGVGDIKSGTVVITSHGISPEVLKKIKKRADKIIDTTCPFVLKAQKIAAYSGSRGYRVVIVGDASHPEIKALRGFVPGKAFVVKDKKETGGLRFKEGCRIAVISQTTQSPDNFKEVVDTLRAYRPKELKVFKTICRDAETRQASARRLASKTDIMLVVGGRDSANTRRLYEVCRKISGRTHLLETEGEVKKSWFKSGSKIGITSGASTPDWIIKRVLAKIKYQKFQRERGCIFNG
jgi:4-hydroxy-3-methylbut-2-enyl diphosphate reductase